MILPISTIKILSPEEVFSVFTAADEEIARLAQRLYFFPKIESFRK